MYISMFYKVLQTFLLFLLWYSFFIIAFALGFYIMLHKVHIFYYINKIKINPYKNFVLGFSFFLILKTHRDATEILVPELNRESVTIFLTSDFLFFLSILSKSNPPRQSIFFSRKFIGVDDFGGK